MFLRRKPYRLTSPIQTWRILCAVFLVLGPAVYVSHAASKPSLLRREPIDHGMEVRLYSVGGIAPDGGNAVHIKRDEIISGTVDFDGWALILEHGG